MPMMKIGKTVFMGEGSSYIPYSALEYNGSGAISGISGSAIAGGVDSAVVSSIVSSYVESSVSGKADQSSLDDCCSAMSAEVSAKLDATASSLFQPSGEYAYESALSSYLPSSASSNFAPSADYAYNSALSSKLDASASSDFYSTSNPSGFITGVDLSEYQEKSDMSAYQLTADMSAYQPSGDYAYASSLSARDYSGINPIEVDNVERLIGVTSKELRFGSGLAVSSDADSDTVYVTAQGGGGGDQYVPLSSTGGVIMYNSVLTVSSTYGLYVGDGNYTVRLNSSEVALTDTASQISAVMNKSGISGASGSRTLWSYGSAEHEKLYSAYSFLSGHSAILWGNDNNAQSTSLTIGSSNTATMASLAQGLQCKADYSSVALGSKCTAYANSVAVGYSSKADSSATAFGSSLSAVNKSFVIGQNNKLGRNFGDSGAFVIGDGTASGSRHDLMAVTTDGEIKVYSATSDNVGLPLVATLRAISAWAVANGWTGM